VKEKMRGNWFSRESIIMEEEEEEEEEKGKRDRKRC